jgi:putative transcriptional regulator
MLNQTVLKNRVRELRRRLKLRQSDVAEEIGVTRQTILAIEKGRLNPSTGIALRISRVLREPVDYVFFLAPEDSVPEGTTEPDVSNSSIPKTAGAVLDLV